MRIRPLVRADIPRVLEISVQLFSGDEVFKWLYSHQEKHPNDLRRYQLIRYRLRLVERGGQGYVAETDPNDEIHDGRPKIVSFGFFVREGSDEAARRWREDSLFNKFERQLLSWEAGYETMFLQRAADPKAQATWAVAKKHDFYDVLKEYWLLGMLGVDPAYQRRGIGGIILKYGLRIAADEKAPVTLQVSVVGRKLYQKLGFVTIQSSVLVDGLKDMVAMLWEPPDLKGAWLVEGEEGELKVKASA